MSYGSIRDSLEPQLATPLFCEKVEEKRRISEQERGGNKCSSDVVNSDYKVYWLWYQVVIFGARWRDSNPHKNQLRRLGLIQLSYTRIFINWSDGNLPHHSSLQCLLINIQHLLRDSYIHLRKYVILRLLTEH